MIAVDAMGGDYAPRVVVAGALKAAQSGIPVLLCGDQESIITELDRLSSLWHSYPIRIEPCTQIITMAEEPSRAVIRKKDSSLVRAAQAVKEGRADALVSAGNSGAVLAVSVLILGRVSGVLRPALGNLIPTPTGGIFCLDLGANTDCKVEYLQQFALFGSIYMQEVHGIEKPRVALLSNGHEPHKGSQVVKETYAVLEKSPQIFFIGNLESRDMFDGVADVLVMDGFVGNILLKGIQGTVRALFAWIRCAADQNWFKKIIAWGARPLFSSVKHITDYQKAGGALLIGVQKPVVVVHGTVQDDGVYAAILSAYMLVQKKLVNRINQKICNALAPQNVPHIGIQYTDTVPDSSRF